MIGRSALLVVLAGCDVLFPLQFDDRPAIDHVTVDITLRWIENTPTGEPLLHDDRFDPPAISVRLVDGSTPTIAHDAAGTYSFDTPNLAYTITIDSPTGPFVLDHHVPSVQIALHQAGRRDAALATQTTMVGVSTMTDPLSVTSVLVHTTGVWSTATVPSFDWDGPDHEIFEPPGLLDAGQNDRLYWVGYEGVLDTSAVGSHLAATFSFDKPVTVNDGGLTTVQGTPVSIPQRCVTVSAARKSELNRVTSFAPGRFMTDGADFLIDAIPVRELGTDAAMLIGQQGGPIDSTNLDVTYGNPFPGALSEISMFAGVFRELFLTNADTPLHLQYGSRVSLEPLSGTTCPDTHVELAAGMVGLVSSISLDGTVLSADDEMITLSGDPRLEWDVSPGPIDHFIVTLFEVVIDAGTPSFESITSRNTPDKRTTFDAALFEPGKTYVLQVEGHVGTPKAATGDFSTVAFPNGSSRAMSAAFTIAP